jgi:ADP-ribose pyrophosphatase
MQRTVLPPKARLIPPEAKMVFKGEIFNVYQWQQKMFDGSSETFEMLKRPDTVVILAVKNNKIVVLDEEQPSIPPFIGLPAGRHDKEGETELQAAQRELAEETGMHFKTWRLLAVNQPVSKIEWFVYVYLATDFDKEVPQKLDVGERVIPKLVSYEELLLIIDDPKTRFMPKDLIKSAGSAEGLVALPDVSKSLLIQSKY